MKKYPFFHGKLAISYNGVAIDVIQSLKIPVRQFSEKENIILTVGRIGNWQKATEVLLEAFSLLPKDHEWSLHLTGPVEPSFQPILESFFKRNPHLRANIVLHGNIVEKHALYELYNRAKIFCLTSRYEGMALVVPEAMYFKNSIVTTRVGGHHISVSGGKTGKVIEKDDPQNTGMKTPMRI